MLIYKDWYNLHIPHIHCNRSNPATTQGERQSRSITTTREGCARPCAPGQKGLFIINKCLKYYGVIVFIDTREQNKTKFGFLGITDLWLHLLLKHLLYSISRSNKYKQCCLPID